MTEKRDVWVVIRFDGPAQEHTDYVSIKGIFETQAEAQAAADRGLAQLGDRQYEAQYHIVRSRHLSKGSLRANRPTKPSRVQGFALDAFPKEELQHVRDAFAGTPVPDTLERVPVGLGHILLRPLFVHFAESLVASALGAEPSRARQGPDLVWKKGQTIEVKTIFLDKQKEKSPFVQLANLESDWLAIVLIEPASMLVAARLFPASVLNHYKRLAPNARRKSGAFRLTSDFWKAPGARPLQLGKATTPS